MRESFQITSLHTSFILIALQWGMVCF